MMDMIRRPSKSASRYARVMSRALLYIAAITVSVLMISPLVWMLSASLKESGDVLGNIKIIPHVVRWDNYIVIWQRSPLYLYLFNSLKLTVGVTVVYLFTTSFAAYAFAKLVFPFRNGLFFLYIITMIIPFQVIMIPQFMVIRRLGLHSTYVNLLLILAFSPTFSGLGVFLFRQFFWDIPDDLLDAGRIDGMGEYRIFFSIVLPLAKPAVISLGLFSVLFVWNDYLAALIYIYRDSQKTIELAFANYFTLYGAQYNLAMAVAVVAILPVVLLYVYLQKYIVEGIAMTGIKA
jgi:multiple sugar transport system permease protein